MSYRRPAVAATAGWSEDAERAMVENPGYFMRWYTLKSLGLVAALAGLAYYVGKEQGRRDRRGTKP